MHGAQEIGTGDHMIVEDRQIGNTEDVVVVKVDGEPRVKRVVQQMNIQMPSSPILDSTVTFGNSLAEVGEEAEKRLLAIYKMFPATTAS